MTEASESQFETAPRLYPAPRARAAASVATRLLALALAIGCLALLVVAARLQPSPTGVGSHLALGLQRCQLLERSGIPCPSCGMTTSFTWFARGNLAASFYVQPMGMLIALSAACCVWAGAYIAFTGRPVYRIILMFSGRVYLIGLLGFAIAAWGWKIYLQLNGLDGWR
jgi:hypothetical protein